MWPLTSAPGSAASGYAGTSVSQNMNVFRLHFNEPAMRFYDIIIIIRLLLL